MLTYLRKETQSRYFRELNLYLGTTVNAQHTPTTLSTHKLLPRCFKEHLSSQHPLRVQYGRTGGGGPWLQRGLLQGKYRRINPASDTIPTLHDAVI